MLVLVGNLGFEVGLTELKAGRVLKRRRGRTSWAQLKSHSSP